MNMIKPGFTGNCLSASQAIAGCWLPLLAWLSSPTSSKIISLWRRSRSSGTAMSRSLGYGKLVESQGPKDLWSSVIVGSIYSTCYFGHSPDFLKSCTSSETCLGRKFPRMGSTRSNSSIASCRTPVVRSLTDQSALRQLVRRKTAFEVHAVHGGDICMAVAMCGFETHRYIYKYI